MKVLISLVVAISIVFSISGCGGSDNTSSVYIPSGSVENTNLDTTDGLAYDGPISGAKVCYDINFDLICNSDEVYVLSDANGSFSLTYDTDVDGQLILTGGIDTGTNLPFDGIYSAPKGSSVVSPLTTLINAGMTEDEVKAAFNITFEDENSSLLITDPQVYAQETATAAIYIKSLKAVSGKTDKEVSDIIAENKNIDEDSITNTLTALGVTSFTTDISEKLRDSVEIMAAAENDDVFLTQKVLETNVVALLLEYHDGNKSIDDINEKLSMENILSSVNDLINPVVTPDPIVTPDPDPDPIVTPDTDPDPIVTPEPDPEPVIDINGTFVEVSNFDNNADINITEYNATDIRVSFGEIDSAYVRGFEYKLLGTDEFVKLYSRADDTMTLDVNDAGVHDAGLSPIQEVTDAGTVSELRVFVEDANTHETIKVVNLLLRTEVNLGPVTDDVTVVLNSDFVELSDFGVNAEVDITEYDPQNIRVKFGTINTDYIRGFSYKFIDSDEFVDLYSKTDNSMTTNINYSAVHDAGLSPVQEVLGADIVSELKVFVIDAVTHQTIKTIFIKLR